ncbi:MAG: 2-aminoethylphosphonate--pyruvate transaminase [Geminicoccaceae bacterium]|nr:2-aminoethylphosphonate--pyruvate transaminase [Geminicoccaceae bacterium]
MPEIPLDPWLLTPGPLTTSAAVKAAMLHDRGSRDPAFLEIEARVRRRLVALVHGEESHVCVPIQGSGTFAVEAMLGTFVPRDGRLLVLVNGAYGRRMVTIAQRLGRSVEALEWPEDRAVEPEALARRLARAPAIDRVAVVHCETTAGVLNPLAEIAAVAARFGAGLLVDAMSSFGVLPVDARALPFTALAASANKCLEGVPGVAFVLCRREELEAAGRRGDAPSLVLDLADQYAALERTGQWRFTPPTHVIAALDRALDELEAEGGPPARLARYRENMRILLEGMRALGFEPLLSPEIQAPIIATFAVPADPRFSFPRFYELLRERGYVIYPGKLTREPSFRIGCIGRIGPEVMRGAVAAVREVLAVMGVASGAPARATGAAA